MSVRCTCANGRLTRQFGYTLVELSLAVLILGIMAATIIPAFFSPDPARLNLAAQEFADAMRFARSEAMRLREPVGFSHSASDKRIRLFRADTGALPWVEIYDVYHPVSKKPYDISIDDHAFAAADAITVVRQYRGSCNRIDSVYFDVNGVPRCLDPQTVPLDQYDVTMKIGDQQRLVSLRPLTGQVIVE